MLSSKKIDERYPWLDKMFHFTSINLKIEDEIGTLSQHFTRGSVKNLKILSVSAAPETLGEIIRKAMTKYRLADCEVLDKNGERIDCYYYVSDSGDRLVILPPETDPEDTHHFISETHSDLKQAVYFVLSNFVKPETVVLYEITTV